MSLSESITKDSKSPLGLYLHIPYCSSLCHYCDFPKTANFQDRHVEKYFQVLANHLDAWLPLLWQNQKIYSVNIGGGTPSLFADEYNSIFEKISPYLTPETEISLEANPDSIDELKLKKWDTMGINRISVGVQTFADRGLRFLKRSHGPLEAYEKVKLCREYFPNTNLDLIYGWQGQTIRDWETDLQKSLDLNVAHLSCYSLTYAAKTPIGRAMARGRITPQPEELEISYYQAARVRLSEAGFIHDEVSNWTQPGYTCQHNWLYWQDGYLLGIGNGAFSYLPDGTIGKRFSYPFSDRKFIETAPPSKEQIESLELDSSAFDTETRDKEAWLIEYIGSALRCSRGCSLQRILHKTGFEFSPSTLVKDALKRGLITLQPDETLTLSESEWIRETRWALEIIGCFGLSSSN